MTAFMIDCVNRPGELARVCEAVAARGVDITSCASVTTGDRGVIGLTTSDADQTRVVMQDAGLAFREYEVVSVRIGNRPGSLAMVSGRLSSASVNVEYLAPTSITTDAVTLAIGVSDPDAARQALSGLAD